VSGVIHRANDVGDDWPDILAELTRAFEVAREAAIEERSFVFVVRQDDLLGRRGAGDAMVATGLLSAARTAALEGSRKGWNANVLAIDAEADPAVVNEWAHHLLNHGGVTGELVRIGPGHLGKAVP
jgi:hypothetical protein